MGRDEKRIVQDATPRCFASAIKWMELPFVERKKKKLWRNGLGGRNGGSVPDMLSLTYL